MYQLLENYIRLVFESEDGNKQNQFHDIYNSFFDNSNNSNNSNNNKKPNQCEEDDQARADEKEENLPVDLYYYTRPGYKRN